MDLQRLIDGELPPPPRRCFFQQLVTGIGSAAAAVAAVWIAKPSWIIPDPPPTPPPIPDHSLRSLGRRTIITFSEGSDWSDEHEGQLEIKVSEEDTHFLAYARNGKLQNAGKHNAIILPDAAAPKSLQFANAAFPRRSNKQLGNIEGIPKVGKKSILLDSDIVHPEGNGTPSLVVESKVDEVFGWHKGTELEVTVLSLKCTGYTESTQLTLQLSLAVENEAKSLRPIGGTVTNPKIQCGETLTESWKLAPPDVPFDAIIIEGWNHRDGKEWFPNDGDSSKKSERPARIAVFRPSPANGRKIKETFELLQSPFGYQHPGQMLTIEIEWKPPASAK